MASCAARPPRRPMPTPMPAVLASKAVGLLLPTGPAGTTESIPTTAERRRVATTATEAPPPIAPSGPPCAVAAPFVADAPAEASGTAVACAITASSSSAWLRWWWAAKGRAATAPERSVVGPIGQSEWRVTPSTVRRRRRRRRDKSSAATAAAEETPSSPSLSSSPATAVAVAPRAVPYTPIIGSE